MDKIVALGRAILANKTYENYSTSDMEGAFKAALSEKVMGKDGRIDLYKWEQHKPEIFSIMTEIISTVEPKKVLDVFGLLAEIKQVPDNQTTRFTVKKGVKNVKRFVTKVALAGKYERVRLDRDYVEVTTYAHGGAIYQTLEGFLSGRESLSELVTLFMAALEESLYDDIMTAINGLEASLPAANKAASVGAFSASTMGNIIATVSAYGKPVIYTSLAFAQTNLIPASGWVSDVAREEMRNQGYLGKYLGADVVVLEQSLTDETNTTKVINEKKAYVMPTGSNERPIKVVLEGDARIREIEGADWSKEMQIYRKAGIAVLNTNHFGIYEIS